MVNPINNRLIQEAKILITDTLSEKTDPVEKELNRWPIRIGSFIGGTLCGLGMGPAILADALVDQSKREKINAKLITLQPTKEKLDNVAESSRTLQEKVYKNILAYTQTAQKIKWVTAASLLSSGVGGFIVIANTDYSRVESVQIFDGSIAFVNPAKNPELQVMLKTLVNCGLFVGMASGAYLAYHRLTARPALQTTNETLAQEAIKHVYASESTPANG